MQYYHMFKKLLSYDKYFKDSNIFDELSTVYNTEEWKQVMDYLYHSNMNYKNKNLITKNSYLLANKIKKDLDISVFPVVKRIHLGSMSNSEGFATWVMYDCNMNQVGSNQPVKEFLLKKHNIVSTSDGIGDMFLFAQLPK